MDLDRFIAAQFKARERRFKVPALKDFFGEDEEPEWVVRGLTAAELARAQVDADEGRTNLGVLLNAALGEGERAESLKSSLGLSDSEMPRDISLRIAQLCMGSVEPKLGLDRRDVAVQLAHAFPLVLYNLTNEIQKLSGEGADLVKPQSSGKTEKSEQQ